MLRGRREFLLRAGAGFGATAVAALLQWEQCRSAKAGTDVRARGLPDPSVAQVPHRRRRAKSVIFLFMEGGPSHIDLFDPKPLLSKLAGRPLPASFGRVITPMGESRAPLLPSRRKWKRYGEGGLWVSDWLPHIAGCADDLCVIRSLWGNGINHAGGVCQMNTGVPLAGRPSLGAWVSYGLGTENSDLPAFVVMQDNDAGQVVNGPRNWGTGFMPAQYQGMRLRSTGAPIENLAPPAGVSGQRQREKLRALRVLNGGFAARHPEQTELDARLKSYELAFRMQAAAPEAVDLSRESQSTQRLYGLDDPETERFGRLCLLARRLVERGVRFVQLYHGTGSKWDAHSKIEQNHAKNCRQTDRPIAGLLKDLKLRGLLDETLVVWGGEFGRTPMSEKGDGRDHNPYGFTMWLAGGGVLGGRAIGATDEVGLHAVERRVHIHDFHATILYLLGLDPMRLVYFHQGRPERAHLNEGRPVLEVLG
ncbi:MAG: DUF1501 domain-containing protein [Planctomycetota bacterium]|nr:MAG: DUF1501 domain-containing protein [Planctomycetota bacterium]